MKVTTLKPRLKDERRVVSTLYVIKAAEPFVVFGVELALVV